jgi:hypothetical protein
MRRLSSALLDVVALPLVVAVGLGVAIGYQLIGFVDALVEALIVAPITFGRHDEFGEFVGFFHRDSMTVVIWGVPFSLRGVVSSGLALLALLAAALLLLRLLRRAVEACPDCGSVVPATATVCHACTADLGPQIAETQAPDTVD